MSNTQAPATQADPAAGEGHPVGTGVGAVLGGAAAGALTGSVAGPVGTVIGIALGAIAGGFAGKEFAAMIDPEVEEEYWRDHYSARPYVPVGSDYGDFAPAFSYGIVARINHPGRAFDEIEPELSAGWSEARGSSRLEWAEALPAARDAWNRVDGSTDAQGQGRAA